MLKLKHSIAAISVASGLLMVDLAFSLGPSRALVFPESATAPGSFPDQWIHGSKSAMDNEDPAVQVYERTFSFRASPTKAAESN